MLGSKLIASSSYCHTLQLGVFDDRVGRGGGRRSRRVNLCLHSQLIAVANLDKQVPTLGFFVVVSLSDFVVEKTVNDVTLKWTCLFHPDAPWTRRAERADCNVKTNAQSAAAARWRWRSSRRRMWGWDLEKLTNAPATIDACSRRQSPPTFSSDTLGRWVWSEHNFLKLFLTFDRSWTIKTNQNKFKKVNFEQNQSKTIKIDQDDIFSSYYCFFNNFLRQNQLEW